MDRRSFIKRTTGGVAALFGLANMEAGATVAPVVPGPEAEPERGSVTEIAACRDGCSIAVHPIPGCSYFRIVGTYELDGAGYYISSTAFSMLEVDPCVALVKREIRRACGVVL